MIQDSSEGDSVNVVFRAREEKENFLKGSNQTLNDPVAEMRRIVQRLKAIIEDHQESCKQMKVILDADDCKAVVDSLKSHAKGGSGLPVSGARDEVHGYCLNRLFEEMVGEPHNILFPTKREGEEIKYEAMSSSFWIECLELLELKYCP